MLPVSVDCLNLIIPSVFSNVYVSFLSFVAMLKNNKLPFVVTLFVSTCNKTKYITQTEN